MTTNNRKGRNRQDNASAPAAPPVAEQAPVAPVAPAPVAPSNETVATKETQDSAKAEAKQHFATAVKELRKGVEGSRQANLTAGREFALSLRCEFAGGLSPKSRAGTIETMEAEVLIATRERVNVNDLIRAYYAYSLFAEKDNPERGTSMPYWLWKESLSRLIEQRDYATKDERFVILEGYEAQCLAVYDSIVSAGKYGDSREGAREKVDTLLVEYHQWKAAKLAEAAETGKEKASKLLEDANTLKAEREGLERDIASLDGDVSALKDAITKESDPQKAAQLSASLTAKQEEMVDKASLLEDVKAEEAETQRERQEVKAEATKAEKGAKLAESAADRLSGRLTGEKKTHKVDDDSAPIDPKAFKDRSPKDVAGMLFALIAGHGNPEGVFYQLLTQLESAKDSRITAKIRGRAFAALNCKDQAPAAPAVKAS